jgi:hypothetical protein
MMVAEANASTKARGTFPSEDMETGLSGEWNIRFDGVHDGSSGSDPNTSVSNKTAETTVSFEPYDANVVQYENRKVRHTRSHPVQQVATSYRTRNEYTMRRPSHPYNANYKRPLSSRPDLDLVLAMERTLFAALNNAWLLALGGVGLMSVGNGDARATRGGIVIIVGAIISAIFAMVMHASRIHGVRIDRTTSLCSSVCWSILVVSLTLVALALELNFGIAYPYLEREQEVTIVETIMDGDN